ncbi:hypothetical protein PMAYCL1PPCAC_17117 [Pristionchus mayeri]|uniref:Nuclear receptor n=1 Tax=Pristionchus mayeri TaxID=1317129 RepID=A0AAN5CM23_9BILA|nr:hypothetical protein PMAYCL1PPCAC_17117 [Pristionchus mayeri]
MPAKGSSKRSNRPCLVCGTTTRIAHLGVECCRACAVFYRRARRGNNFTCRSRTGRCAAGKELNCKKCRLDRINALLESSGVQPPLQMDDDSDGKHEEALQSTSTAPGRTLLDRVRIQYNAMCFTRLSSELNARADPPHPLEISLEKGPFFRADFDALVKAMRMLLTTSLEFGRNTFDEITQLTDADKWRLATNFFYHFRVFEGCYRANKYFPSEPDIYFVSYASYTPVPFDAHFLSTAPRGSDVAGAIEYMKSNELTGYMKRSREIISRVILSEEEFLAIVVLMFWSNGDLSLSEEIVRIGAQYREQILKELHAHYQDKGLDNYASRLGELMIIVQMFEKGKDLKVQFEVMRLFNIMTEDNFIYRLQKDLTIN